MDARDSFRGTSDRPARLDREKITRRALDLRSGRIHRSMSQRYRNGREYDV